MPSDKEKTIKFVAKLLELTQDGAVTWTVIEPRQSLKTHPDFPVDLLYVTTHKDKRLGLYQQRRGYVTLRDALFSSSGYSGFESKNPSRVGTFLEMIDDQGNCLWSFSEVNGLQDLYDAVQYQVAGVKGYLDAVLGDEDKAQ
jgi:hypothetical protein